MERRKSIRNQYHEKDGEIHHTYQPNEKSEIDLYKAEKVIYQLPLAPWKVEVVSEPESDKVRVQSEWF